MVRFYLYSMVVHRNDYLQVKLYLTIQSQKRNDSPLNVIEKKKSILKNTVLGLCLGQRALNVQRILMP